MAPKAKKRGAGTASGPPPARAPAAKKKKPQVPSETDDPLEDHGPRRQKKAPAVGQQHMLFRIFVEGEGYRTCSGREPGHVADSRVHRLERVIGFKRDEQDDIDEDVEAARLHEVLRDAAANSNKYEKHATNQAYLERYMLERHPASDYAKWLARIEELSSSKPTAARGRPAKKLEFMQPPHYLTTSWGMNLRKDATVPLRVARLPHHASGEFRSSHASGELRRSALGAGRGT